MLLLLPTTTYRAKAFIDAALRIGVDVVAASERPSTLEGKNPAGLLTLDFADPEIAARQAFRFAEQFPVDAVIPVDEDTAVVAASVAQAIGLKHNSIDSVRAAKNKYEMRNLLRSARVRVPEYWHFTLDDDRAEVAARVTYPCVVKPVFLSTSRGVMRANDEGEFVSAVERPPHSPRRRPRSEAGSRAPGSCRRVHTGARGGRRRVAHGRETQGPYDL